MAGKPDTVRFFRKRLPHWEVVDGRYFITMRLHGALPQDVENEIRQKIALFQSCDGQDRMTVQRQVFKVLEQSLDNATDNCRLQNPQISGIVRDAIRHRHENGTWKVIEFVIMPNHIHLFVEQLGAPLSQVMQSFKTWTATRITSMTGEDGSMFWQREWFDHWSRSSMEDDRIISYIRNNPVKAGLVKYYTEWPYGSWSA